jgi:hypothetical protein
MRGQIEEVIGSCNVCAKYNIVREGFHPLRPIDSSEPWQHIAIDSIGPFMDNKLGMTMVLVVTDLFSRFTILAPLKEKTKESVAQELWKIFATFGYSRATTAKNL